MMRSIRLWVVVGLLLLGVVALGIFILQPIQIVYESLSQIEKEKILKLKVSQETPTAQTRGELATESILAIRSLRGVPFIQVKIKGGMNMFHKLFINGRRGRRKVTLLLLISLLVISLGPAGVQVQGLLICNKNGALVPEAAEEGFALLEAEIAEYTADAFTEFFRINADLTNAEAAELGRRGVTVVLAHYDKALWRMRNLLSLIDQLEVIHIKVLNYVQRVGIRPGLGEAMMKIDFRALQERLMKERIIPMETAIWDETVKILKTAGPLGVISFIQSNIGTYKQLMAELADLLIAGRELASRGELVESVRLGKLPINLKASVALNAGLGGLWMGQYISLIVGEAYKLLKAGRS